MSEEADVRVDVHSADAGAGIEQADVVMSAGWDWLVAGYRGALARFTATASERDPKMRFIPLFETLNWAVAILDDNGRRGPRIDSEIVNGLRVARNRVHHQLADALDRRDVPTPQAIRAAGRGSGIVSPPVVAEWFWKPLERLPDPPPEHKHEANEQLYSDHLAGQPARLALDHLDSLLS